MKHSLSSAMSLRFGSSTDFSGDLPCCALTQWEVHVDCLSRDLASCSSSSRACIIYCQGGLCVGGARFGLGVLRAYLAPSIIYHIKMPLQITSHI